MNLEQKIEAGLAPIKDKIILHTAPHHDDILLGYFPYVMRNLKANENHVLYISSGSNGVSDQHLSEKFPHLKIESLDSATKRELKFAIREAESEKKWSLCADNKIQIKHLRAEFYDVQNVINYDEFSLKSAMERDIHRIVKYLQKIKPDIITMLVDPVGIGPVTHYRSQQVLTAAIAQLGRSDISIIGYRNVWSSFTLEEASMIMPVTQDELDKIEQIFTNCFATQNKTMILDEDGFAQQTIHIQKMQLQQVETLLNKQVKNAAGALFLQKLFIKDL